MTDSPEVRDALQEHSVAELQRALSALSAQVTEGFNGVHRRQDTTNGRIAKGEQEVALLKFQMESDKKTQVEREALKEKIQAERGEARVRLWQVITVLVGLVISLSSYILYKNYAPRTTTITIPQTETEAP